MSLMVGHIAFVSYLRALKCMLDSLAEVSVENGPSLTLFSNLALQKIQSEAAARAKRTNANLCKESP